MLWLKELLGKGDRESFGRTVMKEMAKRNPEFKLTLDMDGFQIVATNAEGQVVMTAFLYNLYAEYQAAPLFQKYKVIENSYKGRIPSQNPALENFEEVRASILPRVRPRAEWTAQDLWAKCDEFNKQKFAKPAATDVPANTAEPDRDLRSPYVVLADFYGIGLCVDAPETIMYINNHHLTTWQKSLQEVLDESYKNLEKMSADKEFETLVPGLYSSVWQGHPRCLPICIDRSNTQAQGARHACCDAASTQPFAGNRQRRS